MGCSREKGKTQHPPQLPTGLVEQRQAGPQLSHQNPRLASSIEVQLARRAASAPGRRRGGSAVRVCARVCAFRSSCSTGYCKTPSVAPCARPVGPCCLPNVHIAVCTV